MKRRDGQQALTFDAWKAELAGQRDTRALVAPFLDSAGGMMLVNGKEVPRRLVVYHSPCHDGYGAAWAVHRLVKGEVEFRPGVHGDAEPITPADVWGRDVLFLDFAYKRPEMDELAAAAGSLAVLDHHRTAQTALKGASYAMVDVGRSGAGIAWDELSGGMERTWLTSYVEDRDLWLHALPETQSVNAYLGTLEYSFESWDAAFDLGLLRAIEMGRAVLSAVNQYVLEMSANAMLGTFDGHAVPCVNAPYKWISELLGNLKDGHPFSLGWFVRGDGLVQYSLRSDGRIDVSEIARKYGGGGHRGAAGFQLPEQLALGLKPMPRLKAVG